MDCETRVSIVKVDENYQHPSLDCFYRLKMVKRNKVMTAIHVEALNIAAVERLMELSHDEHADCDESCEVLQVLQELDG